MIKKWIRFLVHKRLINDQPEKALNLINFQAKFFGLDSSLTVLIAYVYLQLDLDEIYQKQLLIIEKNFKNETDYFILKGAELDRLNKQNEAVEILSHGMDKTGGSSELFNNRGYYLNKLGKYQDAIKDFNEAIRLNPKMYFAYNNRGLSRLKLGDKNSIEDIKKSIGGFSNNAIAFKNLALWELEFGEKKNIAKLVEKAKRRAYYKEIEVELADIEELSI